MPWSLPEGFYKVLAILTALELKPSLLIIDEIENSLHPETLETIIDEIKDSGIQTILTTHSPAVVDIVEPEDLVLVERGEEGESVVRRVEDPEEVKAHLREIGITLSERWLYGKL